MFYIAFVISAWCLYALNGPTWVHPMRRVGSDLGSPYTNNVGKTRIVATNNFDRMFEFSIVLLGRLSYEPINPDHCSKNIGTGKDGDTFSGARLEAGGCGAALARC